MSDNATAAPAAALIHSLGEARFGGRHALVLLLCFTIIVIDGYCMNAPGFAAPALARDWNIVNEGELSVVMAASLLGMIIGAPLFGFIGDRFGRRPAILLAVAVFGGFTVLSGLARSPVELSLIRLIDGIGIGGVASNVIALVSETLPRKQRSLAVVAALSGMSIGGALPVVVRLTAPPDFLWQSIFITGGVLALAILALAAILLPESPVFLALKGRTEQAAAIVRRLTGSAALAAPEPTPPAPSTAPPAKRSAFAIFEGRLALVTPLYWALQFCNFLVIFLVVSWTPYVLERAQMPADQAALVNAAFALGGVPGGLLAARFIDRLGFFAIGGMFLIGAPAVAFIGMAGPEHFPLMAAAAGFAGAAVVGNQFALGAMATIIYPNDRRAIGSGWALSVGRIGSLSGPLLGGALIAGAVTTADLYLITATPLLVAAILSAITQPLARPSAAANAT